LAVALYQLRNARLRISHAAFLAAGLVVIYVAYFLLRGRSLAMDVDSAPEYYRLDLSLPMLFNNLTSYLERAVLLSILVLPLFLIFHRRSPKAMPASWRNRGVVVLICLIGFGWAIAPMALVPSRSNLYVFLPSMFIAVAFVSLCRMSSRWPSPAMAVRPLLIVLLVLVTATTATAWRKGMQSHRRHRHVLDWTATITQAIDAPPADGVSIVYNADSMAHTRLTPEDFTFLRMALELAGCPVDVHINPPQPGTHVFELCPAPHSAVGALTPRVKPDAQRQNTDD